MTAALPPTPTTTAALLRRTWPQRALLVAMPAAAVVALVAAGLLWDLARLAERIDRVPVRASLDGARPGEEPLGPAEPQNILVVGVDGHGGVRTDEGGTRAVLADTMMLLRTDPADGSAEILPLPRDLWVQVPGHGGAKLNAAMAYGAGEDPVAGGPRLLIETVRQNLGLAVNHYVEVDFAGFAAIVDRVGGISVYVPAPARDRHVQLEVAEAGCVHLTGSQALVLARSRYYDARVDGRWVRDPSSDLGRIRRQQLVLRAVLTAAFDRGLRDPVQLRRVLDDLAGAVALDDTLTVGDLLGLGARFRGIGLDDVVTHGLAVVNARRSGQDVLDLDPGPGNQALLARFAGAAPAVGGEPAPSPTTASSPTPTSTAVASTTTAGGSAVAASTTTTTVPATAGVPVPDALAPFTPTLAGPDGRSCAG